MASSLFLGSQANICLDARAVFETTVNRLAQKPETLAKAKPIYSFFYAYESKYGELSQITKLEKRMADLFPEDPQLQRFSQRFSTPGFDPTAVRPIISPATQTRPKVLPSIEPPSVQNTPPTRFVQAINSPKRTLMDDPSDSEASRPRKLARADSPLKGAAGRRLDQQKRAQRSQEAQAGMPWGSQNPPAPLPRDVMFLLSIIPRAETYTASRFKPEGIVRLLQETTIPDSRNWKQPSQANGEYSKEPTKLRWKYV